METMPETVAPQKPRRSGWTIFFIVLITIVVTAALSYWVIRTYIFPSEFKPVELSQQEELELEQKLERLDNLHTHRTRGVAKAQRERAVAEAEVLEPEAYSEAGADRSITFSERELNSLLARNTDLAKKLAIDLSEGLVSAKLLVHVDKDFPILAGQVIKVRAGVETAYRNGRPIVILKGVSIMGVPIPNAWLGGLKNIDLVEQYGANAGFWKAFADGVDNIEVHDGRLHLVLKE
ncbi:MAG: arginine N-succinyltransferase [Gammaproteobacteria bacterium]|jgi:hypothetical protein